MGVPALGTVTPFHSSQFDFSASVQASEQNQKLPTLAILLPRAIPALRYMVTGFSDILPATAVNQRPERTCTLHAGAAIKLVGEITKLRVIWQLFFSLQIFSKITLTFGPVEHKKSFNKTSNQAGNFHARVDYGDEGGFGLWCSVRLDALFHEMADSVIFAQKRSCETRKAKT